MHLTGFFAYDGADIIIEGLKECKSLKYVSATLDQSLMMLSPNLVAALSELPSLRKLSVFYWPLDVFAPVLELIQRTKSIRTLCLHFSGTYDPSFDKICSAITENRSIRYWSSTDSAPYMAERVEMFRKPMAKNRTLLDIQLRYMGTISDEFNPPIIGEDAERQLEINRASYRAIRNQMWSFVKMFALRRDSFLSILPLEIWIKILTPIDDSEDPYDQILMRYLSQLPLPKPKIVQPVIEPKKEKKKEKSKT